MTDTRKVASILDKIAEENGVTVEEMKGGRRCREFVEARSLVAQELYQLGLTQREIGKVLNKRPWTVCWYLRTRWTP